jgi:D-arginine dehydrogenase
MIHNFIVIGAGMAGASAAYELAAEGSVLLVEAEQQPGYHSSGRSAALFTRNYGTPLVRRINALSEPFFLSPPEGFAAQPLLASRGALAVAPPGEEGLLDPVLAVSTAANPVVELPVAAALNMAPFLRPERVGRAVYEAGVSDIEVSLMLQGYLTEFRVRGGQIATNAPVTALANSDGVWTVEAGKNTYRGKTIVNAAGAWADQIGALAGAAPLGLVAKRRTAIIIAALPGMAVAELPCVDFAATEAYIKPDAGQLMASPGDATPTPPQDVQPDEMDVAVLADWVQRETLIPVRRIAHRWAGLRSFVADDSPVVGYDRRVADFMWCAGQGGYGIMMAPALARAVASLCLGQRLSHDFAAAGITESDLGPARRGLGDAPVREMA